MTKQADEQVITEDDIREKVRICMLKVKKDEVFMSHNLTTSDLNIIIEGLDKEKMYQFFQLVCSELNIKKKKKKFISERLEGISFVTEEIANFNPNKATAENTNVENSDKKNPSTSNGDSGPRTIIDDDAKVARKSSNKRRRSSKSPKNPSKGKRRRSANSISFSTDEKTQYAAEVKMEFETEKEEVLSSLDTKYKELFGKIAFCKWKRDPYRPVLICSPYSVPPELRETWMKMKKNTKGDAKRMWYYTYWYGSPLEEAYTQSKRKDFVMYEEGEKRELHHLDKKIQKKIEKGKKLSRSEEQTVQGFKELELELTKKPSQRRPEDFVEYHDAILDLEDTVSIPDEDSQLQMVESDSSDSDSSSEESGSEEETPAKEIKKEKIGNGKKSKKKPLTETVKGTDVNAKGAASASETPKRGKNSKKEKNKKSANLEELSNDKIDKFDEGDKDDVIANNVSAKSAIKDDEEDYFDEDGGRKKKKSIVRGKKNKKGGNKPTEKNEKNEKNENISSGKEKSTNEDDEVFKKRREASLLGKRRGEEREAYKKCCELFQTLTDELQDAIEQKDYKKIMQCIKDIKGRDVNKLTAPFMEETKLPILVKRAKPMLVDNRDKKLRKDLYDELRNVYDEKKDNVPEGWKKLPRSASKNEVPKEGKQPMKLDRKRKNVSDNSLHERQASKNESGGSMDEPIAKKSKDQPLNNSSNHLSEVKEMAKIPKFQQMSEREKAEPSLSPVGTKVAKKKIPSTSLRSLLSRDTKSKEKIQEVTHARKSLSMEETVSKKLPDWLVSEQSKNSSTELHISRKLGLEFLNQVGELFPASVNVASMANSLERALHAWTMGQNNGEQSNELYWERLHKIVGALAGKQTPGPLLDDILNGEYKSAEALINLPDRILIASYEGRKNTI